MKKIELDELKKIEINILLDVHNFCEKNNINYSLCGGTLLGAVRHKGFIPWDDDIDIIMTRENYDKFCSSYFSNNYEIFDCNKKNYGYLYSKVCDKSTILIEKYNKEIRNFGVFIDIFPVDCLKDNYEESIRKYNKINFYKYLLVSWNWKKFYLNKDKKIVRQFIRLVFFLMSRFVSKKHLINKINKKINRNYNEHAKYSACYFGTYGQKEIMESNIFNEYSYIDFESYRFKCFKNYNAYLRNIYGDYMKLPPVEKRVSHHTFDAYYLEGEE